MTDALVRRIGLGITLAMGSAGGDTNYVVLGAVVDGFEHDGVTLTVAEMAILSDKYVPKATGQGDPGKITLQIAYDPTATTTTAARLANALDTNAAGNTVGQNFQISYPAVGTENAVILENFVGFVTKLGR